MNAPGRKTIAIARRAAVGLAAAAVLLSCTTPHSATHPSIGPGSPLTGPTTVTPFSAPPITLTLTRIDNGKIVSMHTGNHVKVILDSTYWTVTHMLGPTLHEDGPTIVRPNIAHCVPGGGCGTVTANFTAVTVGVATIVADRTSCGEAIRCTGTEGTYRVTMRVQ